MKKVLTSGVKNALVSPKYAVTPIKRQPIRLTTRVPTGKVIELKRPCTPELRAKRNTPPSPAPKNASR